MISRFVCFLGLTIATTLGGVASAANVQFFGTLSTTAGHTGDHFKLGSSVFFYFDYTGVSSGQVVTGVTGYDTADLGSSIYFNGFTAFATDQPSTPSPISNGADTFNYGFNRDITLDGINDYALGNANFRFGNMNDPDTTFTYNPATQTVTTSWTMYDTATGTQRLVTNLTITKGAGYSVIGDTASAENLKTLFSKSTITGTMTLYLGQTVNVLDAVVLSGDVYVPEPGAVLLFCGLAGVIGIRRLRKK
jgi:hypothetical protein